MTISHWLFFCGVGLLTTFTPGPAVLMAISNSIARGPRRALVCSLGNAFGLMLVSSIAMAGMGIVLKTSASAFTALKLAGAGYLIYLGIRQWRRPDTAFSGPHAAPAQEIGTLRLFGEGVLLALTNPKAILFFSALFPQFITQSAPLLGQFVVLTLTFLACSLIAHAFYALLAHTLRRQFADRQRARAFNRVSAGLFVVLGLGLLRLQNKA